MNTNNDDGWIALNEQRPTQADADLFNDVHWFVPRHGYYILHWAVGIEGATHWRRLPAPPRIKTQAELDAEEDEKAWVEYYDARPLGHAYVEFHHLKNGLRQAFLAGRASMRGKGGK